MGRVFEVLMHECSRRGVPCCWNWAEPLHVTSELVDEVRWFHSVGETLAVVGCGATSKILSARCEAESRLPSVWPASMAWTCGGRRLAHIVRKKSSGTSGASPFKWRRNCDGFLSPISS